MAYLKPSAIDRRIINPLAMRFGFGGSRALTVPGRRTGRARRVPVIPIEHAGARYLVSPYGESDWVRNLRASGQGSLGGHGGGDHLRVTEIPVTERGPVIAAYRAVTGRGVRLAFETLPDPADHPVFRIEAAHGNAQQAR
jgi:hypothetical protein